MSAIKISLPKAWAKPVVLERPEDAGAIIPDAVVPETNFESAGEWIQRSLWAVTVKKQLDDNNKSKDSLSGSPTSKGPSGPRETKRKGGMKMSEEDLAEDWYAVLNIGEGQTDPDTLRNAYRKRCLETHPDKQPNHSDVEFKKVQKAYDFLSDETARRAYDSSRLFDDSIPAENVSEEKFYAAFDPVFERNKKWSVDDGLPSLGDDNTPFADVKKFYDAWYRYRSWRDFSSVCELEDIHESMERAEKRFYQRENQRMLDKCAKEEIKRIRELVDRAHNNDPRIRRNREAEAAAQQKIKEEREAERERAREAANRSKREAEEAKVREEEEAKKKKLAGKERAKEVRMALIGFFEENGILCTIPSNKLLDNEVRKVNINWLTQKATVDELEEWVEELQKLSTEEVDEKVEAALRFNQIIEKKEQDIGQNRYGEAIKSTKQRLAEEEAKRKAEDLAAEKLLPKDVKWPEEDLDLLTKAIAKFPGGTVERWARIKEMLPPRRYTEDHILRKVKEIEAGWKNGTGDANTIKKQTAPVLGGKTVNKDGDESAEAWGSNHELGNPFKPRLLRMLNKYCADKVSMADAMLKKYAGKEEDFIQALVKKFGPEPPAPAKHADPTASSTSGGSDEWNLDQQKQLEDALRELKDYKDKDKYVKVADKVEGKNAKDCFDRYKYLCALNKK